MSADRHGPLDRPDLYRLERTLVGERLVTVARLEEATHAGVVLVRQLMETHTRETATLQAEVDRLTRRARDLETQYGRAIHQVDQAEMVAAQRQEEIARLVVTRDRLIQKNAELVGEKRRFREALTGKHPLPPVHYRIDIDRDDTARESIIVTLDVFPHKERVHEALAEARRVAERHRGQLRSLRLDTTAWRVVIQRVIEG